jgi:nitroreductase
MNTNHQQAMNLITGRRSVRVFSPGTVEPETVTRLLEAAMSAPSAMTKDPWRFAIVRNSETLKKLAQAMPGGKMLPAASLAIVVCGDLAATFEQNIGYLLQDCSAAIENLLLAAHGMGLGACWVGCYPAESSVRGVKELLALPATFVPVAAIAIGLPGEQLPARTRYQASAVREERWG